MEFFSVGAQARGVIAIGAEAEGVFALGQHATGIVAVGQLATGVIAVGQLARGVIVVGQLAVGVWSLGQLGVGLVQAGGMLAVGARARGLLPLSIWPTPEPDEVPTLVSAREVLDGVVDSGWVEATFRREGDAVVAVVEGAPRPDWELDESARSAVTLANKRRGWLLVQRAEVLGAVEEGGFRDAPSREVRVRAVNVRWPREVELGRKIAGVFGLLAVGALVTFVSLKPVAELVASWI